MATKKNTTITGDSIKSRNARKSYLENWDTIFSKMKPSKKSVEDKGPPSVAKNSR